MVKLLKYRDLSIRDPYILNALALITMCLELGRNRDLGSVTQCQLFGFTALKGVILPPP